MQQYDKALTIVGSAVLGVCLIAGGMATVGKDLSVVERPALQFSADAADAHQLKRQDAAGKAQAANAERKAEQAAEQEAAQQQAAHKQAAQQQAAEQQAQQQAADAAKQPQPPVTKVPAPQPKAVQPAKTKSWHDDDRDDRDGRRSDDEPRDRGGWGDRDTRDGNDRDHRRGGHDDGKRGHDRGGHHDDDRGDRRGGHHHGHR